jgi:hypothetical protein
MSSTGRPITDEDYEAVRDLHAQGLGRNAIARQIHRSGRTVSKLAAELGLSFDRSPTAIATEARVADGRARRAALAQALLEDAERMRLSLFAPCTIRNFGGKDNTYAEKKIDQPPFRDQRDIMSSIGIAIDRAVKLDAYDKLDESMSGVDAWLAAMTGE